MYGLFPMVQRRFNKADLGFHVSGPYCSGKLLVHRIPLDVYFIFVIIFD